MPYFQAQTANIIVLIEGNVLDKITYDKCRLIVQMIMGLLLPIIVIISVSSSNQTTTTLLQDSGHNNKRLFIGW